MQNSTNSWLGRFKNAELMSTSKIEDVMNCWDMNLALSYKGRDGQLGSRWRTPTHNLSYTTVFWRRSMEGFRDGLTNSSAIFVNIKLRFS